MPSFPHIFICYRREDSAGWAGRIADRLIGEFGRDCVFFDIDSIQPGSDFVLSMDHRTANCDALLAVIGKDWLDMRDTQGRRRLDDPNDFVRMEIRSALRRDVRVIPLLVSGAEMPQTGDLPAELAPLAHRGAIHVTDINFRQTMTALIPLLVSEGAARRAQIRPIHPSPALPVNEKNDVTLVEFLNSVARGAANAYPWMQSHKVITVLLMLLAALTFSPLWYPFGHNSPAVISSTKVSQVVQEEPVERPQEAAPPQKEKPNLRDFFVVLIGEVPFDAQELAAEMEKNSEFSSLPLEIARDASLASAFLELSRGPSGDFTFELKKTNTGAVLLAGGFAVQDGNPPTAKDVAAELVHFLKPWRLG